MDGLDQLIGRAAALVVTAFAILKIRLSNYLWTIRHSSARITGNLIT